MQAQATLERPAAKNYWGVPITNPLDAIRTNFLPEAIRHGATRIFREFLLPKVVMETLLQDVWDAAQTPSMEAFDLRLQQLLLGKLDEAKIRNLLDQRAHHVAKQIRPHLTGSSMLDVGTGDGMVTWAIKDYFDRIQLLDVVNYLDPRAKLPFHRYDEGERIPEPDRSFDTVILTNVLHHSLDPMHLLRESCRVTGQRLIIIESVYGDANRLGEKEMPFCLTVEEQFVYTSFFDWFYNRVLHSNVPVPFNFLPPQRWEKIFGELGWRIVQSEDLGIDVEIVPIHHFLYVLEPRTNSK